MVDCFMSKKSLMAPFDVYLSQKLQHLLLVEVLEDILSQYVERILFVNDLSVRCKWKIIYCK